ncbi:MAG TPA: biotin transporter BioY [Bacillota bacterium]|nr:biotin transporter BioY [Bacillota bacterium]
MRPIHLTLGALFICLMAIGGNITVWFPFLAIPIGGTSVPLSLQTFFAILAGFILGKRISTLSMFIYTFLGFIGIPIFAGLKGGPMTLLLPTGGFIISFIIVAFVVGYLKEKVMSHKGHTYMYIAFIGLIINYIFGVSYMYFSIKFIIDIQITYFAAWISMLPFLIKDVFLTILAVIFVRKFAKTLSHNKLIHTTIPCIQNRFMIR